VSFQHIAFWQLGFEIGCLSKLNPATIFFLIAQNSAKRVPTHFPKEVRSRTDTYHSYTNIDNNLQRGDFNLKIEIRIRNGNMNHKLKHSTVFQLVVRIFKIQFVFSDCRSCFNYLIGTKLTNFFVQLAF
jgi:hypothetical protein